MYADLAQCSTRLAGQVLSMPGLTWLADWKLQSETKAMRQACMLCYVGD